MKRLNDVTLIVQASVEPPNLGALVVNKACEGLEFADVVLLTTSPPSIPFPGRFVELPLMDWTTWQGIQSYGMSEHFNTSHALFCECDGFPIHPELWDDKWLGYDYIGAPWSPASNPRQSPAPDAYRVGNGGCSLQSKRLRELLHLRRKDYLRGTPSDVWICQSPNIRRRCDLAGFKYAPVDEAIRFSFEGDVPEHPGWNTDKSFAFHGRNLHRNLCLI